MIENKRPLNVRPWRRKGTMWITKKYKASLAFSESLFKYLLFPKVTVRLKLGLVKACLTPRIIRPAGTPISQVKIKDMV
jgi:hypothetical protein